MAIIPEYMSYDAIGLTELIQREFIQKMSLRVPSPKLTNTIPNLNAIVEFDFERAVHKHNQK